MFPTVTAVPSPAGPQAAAVPAGELKFEPHDEFHLEIRRRVDEYFRATGLRPRGDVRLYSKAAIAFAWTTASYLLLVFAATTWWQALAGVVSLGAAMSCIGFNVAHDGGHHSYSERPWINRLAALSLDLLGGSSYVWARKHNTIHHTYANIAGHDDDIDVGWLGRLSPDQPWRPFHSFQHWYIWPFYALVPFKWYFVDDFRQVLRGRIGDYRIARPRGWDLATFIGGKAVFLWLAFGLPLLFHPWWAVVVCFAGAAFVQGVMIGVVFQFAHCVEEASFPSPNGRTGRMDGGWAVHQVETAVDYARSSRFVTWFVGGLNYQIEHHLMPQVSHVHYPALAPIVEDACHDFGVRYSVHQTLSAAAASHFRWLRRMGRPAAAQAPQVPAATRT